MYPSMLVPSGNSKLWYQPLASRSWLKSSPRADSRTVLVEFSGNLAILSLAESVQLANVKQGGGEHGDQKHRQETASRRPHSPEMRVYGDPEQSGQQNHQNRVE